MNRKVHKYNLVAILLLLLFSGCGGGGGATTSSVTLSTDKNQAIANGTDAVTLTATVKDSNGSPIEGQAIDFNVPQGTSPYLSLGRTNADGTAVIRLKYPPVGPGRGAILTVTATSGGVTSNEVVITFSNPPQNAATVTLEADKTAVIEDGTDKVRLTATVKDENGAPIAGQAVDFNVPPGPFLMGISSYTSVAGQAVGTFIPRLGGLVGSQTISVTASSGGAISNAITITLTQSPANAASITISADKTQAIANGTDAVTLTATVRDINDSPSPGQPIVFNVPYGASPYVSPVSTDANGSASIRLKYPPVGPDQSAVLTVTATSGGVTSNEAVITFSNPPQNAAAVTLEADKTVVIANGTDEVRLTATVNDASGAPVAGQSVNFNIPYVPFLMRLVPFRNYTNVAGQLVVSLGQLPNSFVGSQTISVTASSGGATSNAITITLTQPPN